MVKESEYYETNGLGFTGKNANSTLKVVTDEIETKPILDFNDYSEVIANMVLGSYPKFSVGIYGEWGSGKTTLMSLIRNKLKTRF